MKKRKKKTTKRHKQFSKRLRSKNKQNPLVHPANVDKHTLVGEATSLKTQQIKYISNKWYEAKGRTRSRAMLTYYMIMIHTRKGTHARTPARPHTPTYRCVAHTCCKFICLPFNRTIFSNRSTRFVVGFYALFTRKPIIFTFLR